MVDPSGRWKDEWPRRSSISKFSAEIGQFGGRVHLMIGKTASEREVDADVLSGS